MKSTCMNIARALCALLLLTTLASCVRGTVDRVEDRADRRENRYDRRVYSGPGDRVENVYDRREGVRDKARGHRWGL